MTAAADLAVGSMIFGRELVATVERTQWYGNGMLTAATGEPRIAGSNIHTDIDYAKNQGLTTAIIDGMMSTAWISSMLLAQFGRHYLERGELRTKYIKPTDVGMWVKTLGRVTERREEPDGTVKLVLSVWIENRAGVKLTDGDAVILLPPNKK